MIEVVSSSSSSASSAAGSNDSTEHATAGDEVANAALHAIVEHYQDPIHLGSINSNRPTEGTPRVIQYWIDRLQHQKQDCHGGVISLSLMQGYASAIRPALFQPCSSQLDSRPPWIDPNGVPVLQHYELLLSQWLQLQQTDNSKTTTTVFITAMEKLQRLFQGMAWDVTLLTRLAVTLHWDSEDENDHQNPKTSERYQVTYIILPTMIRLMTHFMDWTCQSIAFATIAGAGSDHDQLLVTQNAVTTALRQCAVVLLAFGSPLQWDPRHMINGLTKSLTVLTRDPLLLYVPTLFQQESDNHHDDMECIDIWPGWDDDSYWKQVQLDATAWNTGTASTNAAVSAFWQNLYRHRQILSCKHHHKPDHYDDDDNNNYNYNNADHSGDHHNCDGLIQVLPRHTTAIKIQGKSTKEEGPSITTNSNDTNREQNDGDNSIIYACLKALDGREPDGVAKAIRAHFFGRDAPTVMAAATKGNRDIVAVTTETRLHLGRIVPVTVEETMNQFQKPFMDTPSRVHVALRYMSLLRCSDILPVQNDSQGENNILEQVLPVLYELLSASSAALVSMGAAALLHLLSLAVPDVAGVPCSDANDDITRQPIHDSIAFVFAKHVGTLLPVLDVACQTWRDGQPMVLLARVQSGLCFLSSFTAKATDNNGIMTKHRRQVTQQFFMIVERHNHKVSDPDGLLWALLVGGVIPLLHQHVIMPDANKNVDAMELGRLGLSALLPIIRYSSGWSLGAGDDEQIDLDAVVDASFSRKLLVPSVVALVHLMVAAYPIMPRHGGKIMSELLGLVGNLTRQSLPVRDLPYLELVKQAAGIALVVCGDRSAQVLDKILSWTNNHAPSNGPFGADIVRDIRNRADLWKSHQLSRKH